MIDLPREAVRAACDAMRAAYSPSTILLSPEAMEAAIRAYLAATEGEREAEVTGARRDGAEAMQKRAATFHDNAADAERELVEFAKRSGNTEGAHIHAWMASYHASSAASIRALPLEDAP